MELKMTTTSFHAECKRLEQIAEANEKKVADFIVTLWGWIAIAVIALACVEVLT